MRGNPVTILLLITLMCWGLVANCQQRDTALLGKFFACKKFDDRIIEIHDNGTYLYYDRGSSCWSWFESGGKWLLRYDTVFFMDTLPPKPNQVIRTPSYNPSQDKVMVQVNDFAGIPVAGFGVSFCRDTISKYTDSLGRVYFDMTEIPCNEMSWEYTRYDADSIDLGVKGGVSGGTHLKGKNLLLLTYNAPGSTYTVTRVFNALWQDKKLWFYSPMDEDGSCFSKTYKNIFGE